MCSRSLRMAHSALLSPTRASLQEYSQLYLLLVVNSSFPRISQTAELTHPRSPRIRSTPTARLLRSPKAFQPLATATAGMPLLPTQNGYLSITLLHPRWQDSRLARLAP